MASVIVAYSFGFREKGYTKSNEALAREVDKIYGKYKYAIIAQKEIADLSKSKKVFVVKRHRKRGEYLDTMEVTSQAVEFMKKHEFSRVLLIAQPFLHRAECRRLLKKNGFLVVVPKIRYIPFDRESDQWWTRDNLRFLIYAILQKTTGRKGY